MRSFRNVWAFYKTTLLVNLSISALAAVFGGWSNFAASFLLYGFLLSVVLKEVRAKSEYVFYRNNGLSRMQLWIFSFLINIVLFLAATSIFILCKIIYLKSTA